MRPASSGWPSCWRSRCASATSSRCSGDLGAGKTTLARALIGALLGEARPRCRARPSRCSQAYATPRLTVAHFDFYRLASAEEARELGFEEAARDRRGDRRMAGARAGAAAAAAAIEIELAETADPAIAARDACAASARPARSVRAHRRADGVPRSPAALARRPHRLPAGRCLDARLRAPRRATAATVLLMDAPRQPDGPPIRDGKPYSRIAHLAEDMVRPFVAIGAVLRDAGLSAPAVPAVDLDKGLLLVEDLGDRAFGREIAAGASQAELWRAAVDALIASARRAGARQPAAPGRHRLHAAAARPRGLRDRDRAAARLVLAGAQGRARAARRARRVRARCGRPCSTACWRCPAAGSCATTTRPT